MKYFLTLLLSISLSIYVIGQNQQFSNNGQAKAAVLTSPSPSSTYNSNSPIENTSNAVTVPNEVNIGKTRFEVQSLASTGRRVALLPDGKISATFHYGVNQAGGFPDRGSGYNHFDGVSWATEPLESLEKDRAGYPCFTTTPNGLEVALSHKSTGTDTWALHTNTKMPDEDVWVESVIPTAVPGGIVWGKVATGGANGNSIHAIGISLAEDFGGAPYQGMAQHLLYFRSTDNGDTWDQQDVIIPGLDSMFYNDIGGENYNISCNGETVAIAVFESWGDIAIFKSTDNGSNWSKTIINDFPLDKYDGNGYTAADIPFDPNAPDSTTIFSSDGSGSVIIDDNGKVHVFFSTMYVFAEGPDLFLNLESEGIAYWNEDMAMNERQIIGSALDMDGDSLITISGEFAVLRYGNTNYTSFPNAAVDDDGNLYCVYTSVREDLTSFEELTFRHIYLVKSSDGGVTWTEPSDLLDPSYSEIYNFVEGMFPSLPERIGEKIDLVYIQDFQPGYTADNETTVEHLVRHIQYDKDSFEPITSTKFLSEVKDNINIYPNPAIESAVVEFELIQSAVVQLDLFDLLGKNVLHQKTQQLTAGINRLPLDIADMESGIYFVQLGIGEVAITRKLVVQ